MAQGDTSHLSRPELEPLRTADSSSDAPAADRQGRGFWRTGLLLVTSAALGGIAVAIWNRRTLERMHQELEHAERLRRGDSD